MRAEELELSIFRDTLTLRGKLDAEAADERAYHRRERGDGEFVRNIFLPFRVDADRVEASAQNGVLRISLYRPEEDRPKRIRISG